MSGLNKKNADFIIMVLESWAKQVNELPGDKPGVSVWKVQQMININEVLPKLREIT